MLFCILHQLSYLVPNPAHPGSKHSCSEVLSRPSIDRKIHLNIKLELPVVGISNIRILYEWVTWAIWVRDTHDDVIKWKHFPRNWPFVREVHRSPVNFPHKGQWRGALMFSLIYAWINDWVNNREAGDLRRQNGHYDVIVMIRYLAISLFLTLFVPWNHCSAHGLWLFFFYYQSQSLKHTRFNSKCFIVNYKMCKHNLKDLKDMFISSVPLFQMENDTRVYITKHDTRGIINTTVPNLRLKQCVFRNLFSVKISNHIRQPLGWRLTNYEFGSLW